MTPEWMLHFAAQAAAALRDREPDPIEDAERAAHFQTDKQRKPQKERA